MVLTSVSSRQVLKLELMVPRVDFIEQWSNEPSVISTKSSLRSVTGGDGKLTVSLSRWGIEALLPNPCARYCIYLTLYQRG